MSLSRYALMIAALSLAGCDREQIKVQQVPKDEQSAEAPIASGPGVASSMPANPHAGMDIAGMGTSEMPTVKWTLPSGWKEKERSKMRAGSFDAGAEGHTADVSIVPLGSTTPEMELSYFNMWRDSLQLAPADKVQSEPVAIGSSQGKLYELSDGKTPGRILVAALDQGGATWYIKMTGEDAVVKEQKPAFLQFLKSISIEAAPAQAVAMANPHAGMPSMGAAAAVPADAPVTPAASGATLPTGWKEIANPPMLSAKYVIQGSGGAQAEVNVSMLNGSGGGMMANVNRWRVQQLGLPPISEEDFSKQAQTVEVAGLKGTMMDMTGTDSKTGKKARLIGIIVPEPIDTWFYKLMGDPQIVNDQKDAFTKFIQAAKFSHAN